VSLPRDLKVGDVIELVSMPDDPDPITPGTKGTIDWVGPDFQGQPQYGVKWENGRTLGLAPVDRIRVLQ
jgi:hypothetical protein